jgi:hypothetical protein
MMRAYAFNMRNQKFSNLCGDFYEMRFAYELANVVELDLEL